MRLFPAESFACSVRVSFAPAATLSFETVITDFAAVVFPGTTVIVVVDVASTPPIVARIVVAVPAVSPVNVAVYVPLL